MSTAVIGANGFLGVEIVKQLLQKNEAVIGVYNTNYTRIPDGAAKISVEDFLLIDVEPKQIIFSAGSFRNSLRQNISLNCELLYTLTQKFRNSRFLYVSSANVYGDHSEVITEGSSYNKIGDYGKSKLTGEFIISDLDSYAIVRLVYLYGIGLDNASFLPFIIKRAKEGNIPLFGEGKREQDYLHVSDAASLCLMALEAGYNQTYLGASGESFSNLSVAELVKSQIGNRCEITLKPEPEKSPSLYYDPAWTRKTLGWSPMKSFKTGIKEMLE